MLGLRGRAGRGGSFAVKLQHRMLTTASSLALRPSDRFTYDHQLAVASVSPSHGTIRGGTAVRVTGHGFVDTPTARCSFGGAVVVAEVAIHALAVAC